MSTPQKELGHIQIATGKPENDVLSAIGSAQLSGVEHQVLIYILRKTWGFNEKKAWIAMSQFMNFTGRTEAGIHKAVRALKGKNIIHVEEVKGKPSIYEFNKNFSSWNGVYYSTGVNKSKGVYSRKQGGIRQLSKGVYASGPTKETFTKAKIQKQVPEKLNVPLSNVTAERIIGKLTDAEIETMGKKFRDIGMEIAGWDKPYADKTWEQRLNLRTENREKFYQKAHRIIAFYYSKGDRVRRLARKMCYEIAGMVNDLGAMERTLDDAEIQRRKEFSES